MLTIVNKGSPLIIVNKRLLLIIVNEMTNFKKTVTLEKKIVKKTSCNFIECRLTWSTDAGIQVGISSLLLSLLTIVNEGLSH